MKKEIILSSKMESKPTAVPHATSVYASLREPGLPAPKLPAYYPPLPCSGEDEVPKNVETTRPKIPFTEKLLVGGIAGIIGVTSTYPLDIIKTRLQAHTGSTGPIQICRSILYHDGLRGFFKGLSPTVTGILPEKAIKLAVNDYLRERFQLPDGTVPMSKQFIAAGTAGTLQVIATNPYEITKIRLQTQHDLPLHQRKTIGQVVQELGLRGMYRGTTSTLARDVPYAMIFFPTYACLKDSMTTFSGKETINGILLAGCTAGATAAALVTPMDVVKTRRQIRGSPYTSGMACFRDVLATEGVVALFKGVLPRMMVQAPLFGITLLAFELQKKFIASKIESHSEGNT